MTSPHTPQAGFGLGGGSFLVLAVALGQLLSLSVPVAAQLPQLPPPAQAQSALQQALLNDPGLADVLRAKLEQSGLTPDQIRARLAASGYPPNMLDNYLGPSQSATSGASPGSAELSAMQALGLGSISLPGQSMGIDTGLIRMREGLRAESLAAGNYVFGVDVFRRTTTQFLPTLAGPVPPDYRLGPGDHLVLILTGDVEFAYTLQVTREGFVIVPTVGQIFVANLTVDQLRNVLYTRLGKVYSGLKRTPDATTRFDISVASVRVNQVYVVGEVRQPGAYQISGLGTVMTALYAAGGLTERANLRQITVQRGDTAVRTIDLYDYLLRGDKQGDIRLETGDVVFVPLHGTRAQITGAVLRPAIYELKPGEALADLIRAAGGFRADAGLRRLSVYRILPVSDQGPGPFPRAVVDVPLLNAGHVVVDAPTTDDPPAPTSPNVFSGVVIPPLALENGDSVAVDSLPPLAGMLFVAVTGMVTNPGRYPWRPGMTLRDLVLLARGPKVGAYLKEAEIARMPTDRTQGQLAQTFRMPMDSTYLFERDAVGRYFGPPGLPVPAAGAPEVPLEPYDNVLIMRQPDFELQRTVYVGGEVRFPGAYVLTSKDERLGDVVDRAGGLTPQAYSEGIRFIRAASEVGRINVELTRALRDRRPATTSHCNPGTRLRFPNTSQV